jgi:hypothetical protein
MRGLGNERPQGSARHRNLEESVLDAITAIAGIAGPEQHFTGGKPHHFGASK